ncbi:MAG: hypothetical protein QME96_14000, partial [Myxococcota bacterium]|nr:hypothetical protein [Myxococcota bacterium]
MTSERISVWVSVLGSVAWAAALACDSESDETGVVHSGLEEKTPGQLTADWVQAHVVPERQAAARAELEVGVYAPTGTDCPTVPAATEYLKGGGGIDVIVYGM